MNTEEARKILLAELRVLRARSYASLTALIDGGPLCVERTGSSGVAYQIEIEVLFLPLNG